jgi:hypothetical protein
VLLAHGKSSEIYLIDIEQDQKVPLTPEEKGKHQKIITRQLLDLKNVPDMDKNILIYTTKVHELKPHLVMLGTSHGFYMLKINQFSSPNVCFSQSFTSFLSVSQVKLKIKKPT